MGALLYYRTGSPSNGIVLRAPTRKVMKKHQIKRQATRKRTVLRPRPMTSIHDVLSRKQTVRKRSAPHMLIARKRVQKWHRPGNGRPTTKSNESDPKPPQEGSNTTSTCMPWSFILTRRAPPPCGHTHFILRPLPTFPRTPNRHHHLSSYFHFTQGPLKQQQPLPAPSLSPPISLTPAQPFM